MNNFVIKDGKKLKCGFTTGSCAAAAVKASMVMLFKKEDVFNVKINTPIGIEYIAEVVDIKKDENFVCCAVQKESGDDPDVTNGILIYSKVEKCECGINIYGGKGIGRVTKDGLKIKKGSVAINPVPLNMIESEVKRVCNKYNYDKGINVTIYVPDGEKIAKKTFNSRLGIVGGISILGTTGIVEPMSERAVIDTIKSQIDVCKCDNSNDILITVGNYSKEFALNKLGIGAEKGVKCSNFIGEALDYAVYSGFKNITLIGHSGKLIKLAGGVMNTHSKIADCRMEIIGVHTALCGGSSKQVYDIMNCVTTDEAFEKLKKWNIINKVCSSIGKSIEKHIKYRCGDGVNVNFIVFGKEDEILIWKM